MLYYQFWLLRRILGRVVKALDLSPSGHSPREFEPRRMYVLWFELQVHRESVAGVMVSIAAFQAVDPGSIPGLRTLLYCEACLA
jgi:hypothetical protein